MATVYRIHPAIGIARVGDSDEFFVGPELIGERPNPPGGFKDAACRVKKQAARFRIFAHHDDGTFDEITGAEADITWTVHLRNKKAAHSARANTGPSLSINPGSRTLTGPNAQRAFDTGVIQFASGPATTVPLGEMRSDSESRLLVLGGSGQSGSPNGTPLSGYFWNTDNWYDDVSDGPVSATITLNADGSTPAVLGAWVVVSPPKYAPHLDSVITLYDRVLQTMIDAGQIAAPTASSYTKDVYPILQRARDTGWVENVFGNHSTWPDPVPAGALRQAIFTKLKAPGGGGGNMPDINDSGTSDDRLTPTQYAHMQRWKDNGASYTDDWAGPPAPEATITPGGLDRAALEAAVGAAFFPGIEAGGLAANARPIVVPGNFVEAFRLSHTAVSAGDLTAEMALPWQNDFWQCADNWWPVPRPNEVSRGGVANQDWTSGVVGSGVEMVDKWSQLGFVVKQGSEYVEAERCSTPSITLLTPLLDFRDVPAGPMGMVREVPLAITFEVISPGGAVTIEYAPSGAPVHPQLVAYNTSVTVGPTAANVSTMARLWIIYRTATPGSVLAPQALVVRQQGTTRQWNVTVIGNTVARKTAATAMALDRSGSMSEDRGDGLTKHASLQQAASIFVDVMLDGDGVGLAAFNQDAVQLQQVLQLGTGGLSDVNRNATKDIINGAGLNPFGATSIGDGIFEARAILNASTTPYDTKALVVLTDGNENRYRYIADVAGQINEHTFAIGLGTPQNTSAPALQAVSGNHGGFLLVTGAIGTDNRFLLQKYFLQILAGISNAEIVLDPDGTLFPGQVQRVPFHLVQGDAGVDVILLTPFPQAVDFRLETPSGQLLDPSVTSTDPGVRYVQSDGVAYYRLVLPREFFPQRFDHEGTWNAWLGLGGRPSGGTGEGHDRGDLRLRAAGVLATPTGAPADAVTGSVFSRRAVADSLRLEAAAALAMAAAPGSGGLMSSAIAGRRALPYSVIVHAYSNLSFQASVQQRSFEPGSVAQLHATLSTSGIPTSERVKVWAEVIRPDQTSTTITLLPQEEGRFLGELVTSVAGVYRCRVRAQGSTSRGEPFSRERTVTVSVWAGGDRDDGGLRGLVDHLRERDERLCELLDCLTGEGRIGRALEERLHAAGLDLGELKRCLARYCADDRRRDPSRDE